MVKFDIPILFVAFQYTEDNRKIYSFEEKQQPKYLYFAADVPRLGIDPTM